MMRPAIRIGVCLVIGVVVNVLVAWGCVWLSACLASSTPIRKQSPVVDEQLFWQCVVPRGWPERPRYRMRGSSMWLSIDSDLASDGSAAQRGFQANWTTYGLPFRSLGVGECVFMSGRPARADARALSMTERWQQGIQLVRSTPTQASPWFAASGGVKVSLFSQRLPLWPLFPGFLVNTLLFALGAWAALFVPGVVRRSRRKRRGLCLTCGYELGGLVTCPECGVGKKQDE